MGATRQLETMLLDCLSHLRYKMVFQSAPVHLRIPCQVSPTTSMCHRFLRLGNENSKACTIVRMN